MAKMDTVFSVSANAGSAITLGIAVGVLVGVGCIVIARYIARVKW